MKSIHATLLISVVMLTASCGSPPKDDVRIPESKTGIIIEGMAEPYVKGLKDHENVGGGEKLFSEDVIKILKDYDPDLLKRAIVYPSYIEQLEICGQDGQWILDDFKMRTSAESEKIKEWHNIVLRTSHDYYAGFFTAKIKDEGGGALNNICSDAKRDKFEPFINGIIPD